MFITAAVAEVH